MKKQFISDLKDGVEVSTSFWVKFMGVPVAKNGKPYINLELMDKTGTITGKIWDNVESLRRSFDQGSYVEVEGAVLDYQGNLQIKIHKIFRLKPDEVAASEYFPVSSNNPDEMLARLQTLLGTITDKWVRSLVFAFLEDAEFIGRFRIAPAAKTLHHAFIHGLLEHTLSLCALCENISGHYGQLNRDLLLAGGFLHDIGKVDELSYDGGFDYSDEGRLIGHLVMSSEMISRKASEIKDFPKETELLLKHL
ncbi:MAG: OB-fold nucleic acid binding domain-containing protein, partial [Phycisphaerae bacterium]|nr:OB-fold nucleic acid binding domain-containing protein [Phycisphaerae bacterium]